MHAPGTQTGRTIEPATIRGCRHDNRTSSSYRKGRGRSTESGTSAAHGDWVVTVLKGDRNYAGARFESVYALSVKSNKVFETSVENIHYDKGMGIAEITAEGMMDFCRPSSAEAYAGRSR